MKSVIGAIITTLGKAVLPIYFAIFRKTRRGLVDLSGIKPPFLLVSNHQATMDPFFIGVMLPGVTSFVATDMLFRLPIMNYLMSAIGSIPKSKFVSDATSVRMMLGKIRRGQSVGVFPEGQRCVAGFTDRIIPGIGKLARILDVPVVLGRLEGGFLADPRWAIKKRQGPSTVSIRLLLTREQLRSMDPLEIEKLITQEMAHSDYEWIETQPDLRYKGRDRALGLHNVMFKCPECGATDCFLTEGDIATCKGCGYSVSWGDRGEFTLINGSRLHFQDLQRHEMWQRGQMDALVSEHLASKPKGSLVLGPFEVTIRRSSKSKPLLPIGTGEMSLYDDRLELRTDADCPASFALGDIEGFTVSAIKGKHHRIVEFMHNRSALYNMVFHDTMESTYKWNMCVDRLKAAMKAQSS